MEWIISLGTLVIATLIVAVFRYSSTIHKYADGWYLEYFSNNYERKHIKLF